MKQQKRICRLRIQGSTSKEGKTLIKPLKLNIKAENTKQDQKRRKNLYETIKKSIQDNDTKQHRDRRKNFDEKTRRISRLRIQSNTSKEGKEMMKQIKSVSKIKI